MVLCARLGGDVVRDLGSVFYLICGQTWILNEKMRTRLVLSVAEEAYCRYEGEHGQGHLEGPILNRASRMTRARKGGGRREQERKRKGG